MKRMTVKAAESCIDSLSLLRYFPAGDGARSQLIRLLMEMCQFREQAEWLANRVLQLYNEWPGPVELRGVFCSKFRPFDGVEICGTGAYPEGVPAESGPALVDCRKHPELPSDDPDMNALVTATAGKLRRM